MATCIAWFLGSFLLLVGAAFGKTYQPYKIDYGPLEKDPALFQELMINKEKAMAGDVSRTRLQRDIEILETTLKEKPDWVDGLWMVASEYFQLGASYTDEKELPLQRSILVKGQRAAESCMKLAPQNPLCKLFVASCIAQIGTIDGVFDSLSNAELVHDLWIDVSESPYNISFTNNISMQGVVRYALGIFYRLVPDYAALEWIYHVRGDLEKSIQYHRDSLAMDNPKLPCSNLMLGASLVCMAEDFKSGSADEKKYKDEGIMYLNLAGAPGETFSVNSTVCRHDAHRLRDNPGEACGYSVSKQQARISEAQVSAKKEGTLDTKEARP